MRVETLLARAWLEPPQTIATAWTGHGSSQSVAGAPTLVRSNDRRMRAGDASAAAAAPSINGYFPHNTPSAIVYQIGNPERASDWFGRAAFHPWLMDLVFVLHWKYDKNLISIFSGYRSPRINAQIEGAALNS
jgi:hypothetical protein